MTSRSPSTLVRENHHPRSWPHGLALMVALAGALGLVVAFGAGASPRAEAAPNGHEPLPELTVPAPPLVLAPEDVASMLPGWLQIQSEPQRVSLAASPQAILFLPLAVRGSGNMPPPVAVTATPTVAPSPTPDDVSAVMFASDRILDVKIEIDHGDWDALRVQARSMADLFGDEECLTEPHVSPFTYYRANVRVNGDLIPNVGVRKKGLLGSISSSKPSLKISFDEYVDRRRYAGLNRLTLNNNKQDPSHVRQCITYWLFAEAGLPAPRCSFARVSVNGRSMGVYTHVESIKKPFLTREYGDDSGNLYEGTLSDFTSDWSGTFEPKTNKAEDDQSDIEALVAALQAEDSELLQALAPVLDVDAFLDFWAMEVLTGHWDGYANNRNNFYFYRDPADERFSFIPWGTDATLRSNFRAAADGGQPMASVAATAHLTRRLILHPEGRERYLQRLETQLQDVWLEDTIVAEINRMASLIEPELDSGAATGFWQEIASARAFVRTRRSAIEAELHDGLPDHAFPPSGPPCRTTIGRFTGTFATRWKMPGVITATASVELAGTALDLVQVDAAASPAGADPWPAHSQIQLAGVAEVDVPPVWRQGDAFVVILFVDPELFGADPVIAIDGRNAFAWALLAKLQDDGSRQVAFMGMLWDGELTLDKAGTQRGNAVSGSIDANIVVFGGL